MTHRTTHKDTLWSETSGTAIKLIAVLKIPTLTTLRELVMIVSNELNEVLIMVYIQYKNDHFQLSSYSLSC